MTNCMIFKLIHINFFRHKFKLMDRMFFNFIEYIVYEWNGYIWKGRCLEINESLISLQVLTDFLRKIFLFSLMSHGKYLAGACHHLQTCFE